MPDIFVEYLSLQQSKPLLHILYEEMTKPVKRVLGHFMQNGAYRYLMGEELQSLDVECSANWKQLVEIGADTESTISA